MITFLQKIGIYVGVSNAIMFYELTHDEYKTEYKRKNNLGWVKNNLGWVSLMCVINPIIFQVYISAKIWDART